MQSAIFRIKKLFCYLIRHHFRSVILFAAVIISASFFEEMVDDVFYDPQEGDYQAVQFDKSVHAYIGKYVSERNTDIMRDLTSLGSTSVLTLLCLVTGLISFMKKRIQDASFLLIVSLGIPILVVTLKNFFGRERPPETNWLVEYLPGLSFPSGHSFGAAAVYLAIAYVLSSKMKYWIFEIAIYSIFSFIILLVGLSRIYLGVHYPTDVIAGISAGTCWCLSVSVIFEAYKEFQFKKT